MPRGYQATPKLPTVLICVSNGGNLVCELPEGVGVVPFSWHHSSAGSGGCRSPVSASGMKKQKDGWVDTWRMDDVCVEETVRWVVNVWPGA